MLNNIVLKYLVAEESVLFFSDLSTPLALRSR
jgi:hypothetical protein